MSSPKVKAAFNQQVIVLPIQSIAAQREILPSYRKSTIYLQISASLEHVGLIEPLVVFPKGPNEYLLLDGHVRLDILKRSGITEVRAIFATRRRHILVLSALSRAPSRESHGRVCVISGRAGSVRWILSAMTRAEDHPPSPISHGFQFGCLRLGNI